MVDEASGFRNLRETWAAPWLGLFRDGTNFRNVAVFPSGHQRELDAINNAFAVQEAGLPPAVQDTESSPYSMTCAGFGLDATLCAPPFPAGGCTACTTISGCPPVTPPTTAYCYDWPGYLGNNAAIPFNAGQPTGHDILFGPFDWEQGDQSAYAYRVVFNRFELQANDYMEFLDENQNPVGRLTANGIGSSSGCSGAVCGPWIYSSRFYVRLVSDGNDSAGVTGWDVAEMEILRRNKPLIGRTNGSLPPITATVLTRPSIFVVDLDAWANFTPFEDRPTGSDTSQRPALVARITSNCDGLATTGETCVDETGTAGHPAQPDLRYMTCPISAEIAVYQEGNVFRTGYVGDECGQIWKLDVNAAGIWTVNRILRLNNADGAGRVLPNRRSEDYRKIYRRLELVLSRCNGSRSIGVVFGTGNIQRVVDVNGGMTDPTIARTSNSAIYNDDGNVIGVVWDSANLPSPATGLSLADLQNVSDVVEIVNPTVGNAANGYFIEFGTAGMYRDPLVLDGVATFKMRSPLQPATECISATGQDFLMQFDFCNAAPIVDTFDSGTEIDSTSDRLTWTGSTDIGGNLLVFAPPNEAPFIATPWTPNVEAARLPGRNNVRAMRVYLWRTDFEL